MEKRFRSRIERIRKEMTRFKLDREKQTLILRERGGGDLPGLTPSTATTRFRAPLRRRKEPRPSRELARESTNAGLRLRLAGHRRGAARWRRAHPPVGALAGEWARAGVNHLLRRAVEVAASI